MSIIPPIESAKKADDNCRARSDGSRWSEIVQFLARRESHRAQAEGETTRKSAHI